MAELLDRVAVFKHGVVVNYAIQYGNTYALGRVT